MTFGVREVSEVVSVTRKRIYVRLGEVSRPSAGTAAQSLQSVRLSLVDDIQKDLEEGKYAPGVTSYFEKKAQGEDE